LIYHYYKLRVSHIVDRPATKQLTVGPELDMLTIELDLFYH